MSKGKRRRKHIRRPRSYYDLSEVIQKISDGQVLIQRNASEYASNDFGWGRTEILKAYSMLKPKHFYKTGNSRNIPRLVIDIYKARLYGEDIYTHFYIDDSVEKLVINSFKRDQTIY